MTDLYITITPDGPAAGESIRIEALDVLTALTVTEINVDREVAELWNGEQRLARLRRRGDAGASYWEVG